MKISLIGLCGAGKTTMATLLGGIFNTMHISSGELARSHGFAGSEAERKGELDPDENKIRTLVKEALEGADQYILDGFPRSIDQIEAIQTPIDAVLHLIVKPTTGAERLLHRGRPDDNLETIGARIATYWRYTHPLVKHFKKKKLLIGIDAEGTMGNTLGQIIIQLSKRRIIEANNLVYDTLKEWDKKPRIEG